MIGFEDGLSQFFGDIRAQPLYGAFEPFVGVTVPEIAFAFQIEDQIKLVSIMGKQRFGRGPARMFVPYDMMSSSSLCLPPRLPARRARVKYRRGGLRN